jgi:hypothetical protein
MMNASAIRSWLLCQPRPALIRVTGEGDAQHEIEPAGAPWARIAQSIEALHPELIEALDANKRLIRAVRPNEQELEPEAHEAQPVASSSGPQAAPIDGTLTTFARLLADAYRHSTEQAFARLTDLFESSTRRTEALERSLERMQIMLNREQAGRWEDALEQAQNGNQDPLAQLVGSFFAGSNLGGAQQQHTNGTNGTTNGKKA